MHLIRIRPAHAVKLVLTSLVLADDQGTLDIERADPEVRISVRLDLGIVEGEVERRGVDALAPEKFAAGVDEGMCDGTQSAGGAVGATQVGCYDLLVRLGVKVVMI